MRDRNSRLTFAGVRQARLLLGLSQAELARRAGIHPLTVWKWESGRVTPSFDEFVAVWRVLGVPLTSLFEVRE